jgi:hypothetical protein
VKSERDRLEFLTSGEIPLLADSCRISVIINNSEECTMMGEGTTQLEGVNINDSGGDSEEVMDMQCVQTTEGETSEISQSRREQPTSADKKGKDNLASMTFRFVM